MVSAMEKDQAKVLLVGSLTEFGERYSYYIIQSLLIFFLIERFNISQAQSSSLVGTVLGVVYISAIVGGYIADKLINHYSAAFLGSLLMVMGSILLSLSVSQNGLFLGLAFISISTGLIKSNISSFIGDFYDKARLSESHRDFGFSIFYVGINLGSFFALGFASYLKNSYGFAVAFYSSIGLALLMCVNLFIGFFKLKNYIDKIEFSGLLVFKIAAIIVLYIALIFAILKNPTLANIAIFVAVILCCIILFRSAQGKYWNKVALALVFFALSILYWALYFQTFISILLFIDQTVAHQFLSFTLGSSQFLSVESLSILILGGVMGKVWLYFGRKGRPIHDIDKFNIAFILIAVVFAVFYIATAGVNLAAKVPAITFFIGFPILAISELSLSAIGLSLITKIAPKGFVSLYMGIWLVTLGIGGKIAGRLSENVVIIADNIQASRLSMAHNLLIFIVLAVIGSVICFCARKKVMQVKI